MNIGHSQAAATTAAAPPSPQDVITTLPRYFPTTCKECTAETEIFFRCFEQHAVMLDDRDVSSAKTSVLHCQPELRSYMACMEHHLKEKERPWWKIW